MFPSDRTMPDGTDRSPLRRAVEALEENRTQEFSALLRAQLQSEAADPVLYTALGVALGRVGDTAGSLQALERAHYLQPDNPHILYNYGLALQQAGQEREAALRFQAVLRLQPQHELARRQLGLLLSPLPAERSAPGHSFEQSVPGFTGPAGSPPPDSEAGPLGAEGGGVRPTTSRPRPLPPVWRAPERPAEATTPRPVEAPPGTLPAGGPAEPVAPRERPRPRWAIDERMEAALEAALGSAAPRASANPGMVEARPGPDPHLPPPSPRPAPTPTPLPDPRFQSRPLRPEPPVTPWGRFWSEFREFCRGPLALWTARPGTWFLCFAIPNTVTAFLLTLGAATGLPPEVATLAWLAAMGVGLAPLLVALSDTSQGLPPWSDPLETARRCGRTLLVTVPVVAFPVLAFALMAARQVPMEPIELLFSGLVTATPFHVLFAPWLVLWAERRGGAEPGVTDSAALLSRRTWMHLLMMTAMNLELGGALWFTFILFHAALRVEGEIPTLLMRVVEISFVQSLWGVTLAVAGFDALNLALEAEGTDEEVEDE